MRTNANCAKPTVIQPKLTCPITLQQQIFQLQPQTFHSTTNTTHFNFPDLYTVSLNNMNVENYCLLSTTQILSYYQLHLFGCVTTQTSYLRPLLIINNAIHCDNY